MTIREEILKLSRLGFRKPVIKNIFEEENCYVQVEFAINVSEDGSINKIDALKVANELKLRKLFRNGMRYTIKDSNSDVTIWEYKSLDGDIFVGKLTYEAYDDDELIWGATLYIKKGTKKFTNQNTEWEIGNI